MKEKNQIVYLYQHQIDKLKWDHCIDEAHNGLVYSYSFYLDHMARQWDALVLNDYQVVMPLTWNKKYGIYYLYQPFLCASLGIFGKNVDAKLTEAFLHAIPGKFKYWDIYLNYGNLFPLSDFKMYQKNNYVLNLNNSYEQIFNGFRHSYKQLFKKFDRLGCSILKDISIEEVLSLAKEKLDPLLQIRDEDYGRFMRLYNTVRRTATATNYGIYSRKGELLASGVFLFSHKRAYYILAGNHPNGRTLGASHQIIHSFIKDHAQQSLLLDFEGSDISNIAFFFKSFGAREEKYPGILYNRLPPLLRWLKR